MLQTSLHLVFSSTAMGDRFCRLSCLDTAIRRIFGFHPWRGIRRIRECCDYPSFEVMFVNAKSRLYREQSAHSNGIFSFSLYD